MPTSTRVPSSERPFPRADGGHHRRLSRGQHVRGCDVRTTRGFTLLELTIVLLILAIAVSFVIPRLRDTDSAALSTSAGRLATVVRYLYEEAALRRRPMRLNLDLDQQAYWISVWNDDPDAPAFVPDATALARPAALPGAVAFADVVLPALGTVTEGIVFAQFLPDGWADPLVVHLTNRRQEYATLAIDPLTGRTRVGAGYIELGRGTGGDPERPASATGRTVRREAPPRRGRTP